MPEASQIQRHHRALSYNKKLLRRAASRHKQMKSSRRSISSHAPVCHLRVSHAKHAYTAGLSYIQDSFNMWPIEWDVVQYALTWSHSWVRHAGNELMRRDTSSSTASHNAVANAGPSSSIMKYSILAHVAYADTSKMQAMHQSRNDTINAMQSCQVNLNSLANCTK